MITDRITEDADWKDGINQFRKLTLEKIDLISKKLDQLEQQTKEKTP
tara:strand:- start:232 stop:372 length:141 start_codon:yes stop_codon:yes gene_type:complete